LLEEEREISEAPCSFKDKDKISRRFMSSKPDVAGSASACDRNSKEKGEG